MLRPSCWLLAACYLLLDCCLLAAAGCCWLLAAPAAGCCKNVGPGRENTMALLVSAAADAADAVGLPLGAACSLPIAFADVGGKCLIPWRAPPASAGVGGYMCILWFIYRYYDIHMISTCIQIQIHFSIQMISTCILNYPVTPILDTPQTKPFMTWRPVIRLSLIVDWLH